MGILSIFGKKDTNNKENLVKQVAPKKESPAGKPQEIEKESIKEDIKIEEVANEKTDAAADNKAEASDKSKAAFAYGVQDTFGLKDSEDLVVIGKVKGTLHVGDEIYITNIGDDIITPAKTIVLGMEINKTRVEYATDCLVALNVKNGALSSLKKGSVIHSEGASHEMMREAYINALGDMFVLRSNFEFSEIDLENMSIADCAEAWKLYGWYITKNKLAETDEQKAEYRKKTAVVVDEMCKKILDAREIYCVCNTVTGEPHLFSKTIKQEQGFFCTPPEIVLIPAAYARVYKERYSTGNFELKKITNGEDKSGIRKFLADAFYIDGACGASVISDMSSVPAEKLVEKPDYSDRNEADTPVTNPELERWILLLTQLGQPKTEEDEIIYKLYFRFMSREITKAKLLVPVMIDGEIPAPNKNGVTLITEDMKISFSTMSSKDGRDAVRMYTDYKKFRAEFTDEWNAMIGPVDNMIDNFDCAINMSKTYRAGCYVSGAMYKEMKELSNWEQH